MRRILIFYLLGRSYFLRGCRILVVLGKINTKNTIWMCAVLVAWGRQTYERTQK
jgi:hypothetical protein